MLDIGELLLKVKTDHAALDALGNSIKSLAKTAAAAGAAVATGTAAVVTESVKAYAEFEQLQGGVEKLFGDSADTIQKYADNAFKTSQLSASEYMELATQFGASMVNACGGDTEKAAAQVDKAINQMRDNASIMGTDMEMLETAYKGFARGSYIALDNLKLGFAGSKEGMEQLLAKAKELSGIEYDIDSYSDIVDAIGVIQDSMNITGNAAEEAAKTIEGSLNMTKSAWHNLLVGLADDEADMKELIEDLKYSAGAFLDNIKPRIQEVLRTIGEVIREAVPELLDSIPGLIQEYIVPVFNTVVDILRQVGSYIIDNAHIVGDAIKDLISQAILWIIEDFPVILETIADLIGGLVDYVEELAPGIETLVSNLIMRACEFLQEHFGDMVDALIDLVEFIAETINENIEPIGNTAVDMIATLVSKLGEHLPDLVPAAVEIVAKLVAVLTDPENLKKFDEAATKLINGLMDGLKAAVQDPAVAEAAKDIISNIGQVLLNNWMYIKNPADMITDKIVAYFTDSLKEKLFAKIQELAEWVSEQLAKLSEMFTNFGGGGSSSPAHSRRTGIDYVPNDGYVAELHRGERVLTAEENEDYNETTTSTGAAVNNVFNITVPNNNNAMDIALETRRLAREEAYCV